MAFKPPKSKIPTKFGGNDEHGMSILMGYMLGQRKKEEAPKSISNVLSKVNEQFPKGAPPGSKLHIGDEVKADIDLNRELTGDEISAIASERVFKPTAQDIEKMVNDGVFDPKMTKGIPLVENIERTYRQWSVGQPNALATFADPDLQAIQGKISSIRRYVFGEGGKQLTPYEANIVNALIKPIGKSNQQYVTDLDSAIQLIEEKSALTQGGINAASRSPVPGMEDQVSSENNTRVLEDELRKLYLHGE